MGIPPARVSMLLRTTSSHVMPGLVRFAFHHSAGESSATCTLPIVVTPGLVPGVHVLFGGKEHVDARDKHGHDDSLKSSLFGSATHFAEPDSHGNRMPRA